MLAMGAGRSFVLGAAPLAALLVGCFGNETTVFPSGLEPLEENTAPEPMGMVAYPEALSLVLGETNDYNFGHARGYVRAPAAVVWEALKDPDVVIDRRHNDVRSYELEVDPDYEWSYALSYTVDTIITVDWEEQWRMGTVLGTPEAPELGMLRYQKVWGSTLIELLEGSIQVIAIEPEVCEVQFIEHVRARGQSGDETGESMQDRFANILARSRGEPLPEIN